MRFNLPDGRTVEISIPLVIGAIVVAIVVSAVFTTFYQIDAQERGVILRFGKYIETAGEGLHTKIPFGIDRVERVPLRVASEEFGYRSHTRGDFSDENLMLTGDLNIVRAAWSVQYTRRDPLDYLFNVREPEGTLRDISQSVMREVMGDRASIPVLTVGRAEIQESVRGMIQDACDQFGMGIWIDGVNLQFISPPREVESAFHDLNRAEQDAARFFEEASQEYQEHVPRARGKAERIVLEAEGFAQRRVNVARGDADRFLSMLEEYSQAEEVTRNRLYLETMESILPRLREITILDDGVETVLPHFNLKENSGANRAPEAGGGQQR